jgi:aryl-alcohol dehydrogenase-like predicted oxidoreductase
MFGLRVAAQHSVRWPSLAHIVTLFTDDASDDQLAGLIPPGKTKRTAGHVPGLPVMQTTNVWLSANEVVMHMRSLGTTGLPVSRIGLGLAALGRPGYINLGHAADLRSEFDIAMMEARAHAVLDAAWEAGIRYFDAARSYGRAEAFLASWLESRQIRPGAVTIGSKWGYTYTADWQVTADRHEIKDHSLGTLRRQVRESEVILGRHLNIYQIHSATLESGVLENREVLEALARLGSDGLKIGLTLTGPKQSHVLRQALDVNINGQRLFDCVQATWNLLEQSAGDALQEAHAVGVGVIVKEVLANGRLTERNTDPSFAPKRELLANAAIRLGTRSDALAMAAVLAQPWADVVLSGAANVDQLTSNIGANGVRWDKDASHLLGALVESPNDYWNFRSKLAWN